MDKPAIEGQYSTDTPAMPPDASAVLAPRTYAWWLILGLVGLDCFSTLGYLPTLAVEGAEYKAPLAAVAVGLLILFAALPVYLYVVGRSPRGRGATGLLEKHLSGWHGKLFILFLLGFVAVDFVLTRTLSTADASKHLLANDYAQSGVEWMLQRKDVMRDALPDWLQGEMTDRVFDWWDAQLAATVVLMALGFALYFFLLRGFTRGFLCAAAVIVALFLGLNGLVIGSSLVYLIRHPEYMINWMDLVGFASQDQPLLDLLFDFAWLAVKSLPALALGLSGFELSAIVAPLVCGRTDDDPARPLGRIRNTRKLLTATAVILSVLVPTSVASVWFLVPTAEMAEGGSARDRALAYLAHGGVLRPPQAIVSRDAMPAEEDEDDWDDEEAPPPMKEAENPKEQAKLVEKPPAPMAADLNPLFGSAFGSLYDLSAISILFMAGASAAISLRDLLPRYLARYGMERHWAQRIGVLLHLFNVLILIVVIAFHARVSHQQGAYAMSVLALLSAAALAALLDVVSRGRRSLARDAAAAFLFLVCSIFVVLAGWVGYDNPAALLIALLFVAVLFFMAGLSRWMRGMELRYYGFTFADEESGIRWEQIRRLEFQVLAPHRPDHRTLADKDADLRARHRLAAEVPIIFIEAMLGDPSDFQQYPLLRIAKQDGREVIRVWQCASIAHVLAAIALEFHEVGRPPEIHFAWSDESPLASNLNFLLWGQGNIPWLVHALIRKAEPDPARQPRVVIG